MELQAGMLCEGATVRDGLLYILGGGVAGYSPAGYPATLQISLAAFIELDYLDQGETHKFAVVLLDEQASELERLDGEFGMFPELALDATATLPLAITLAGMVLPRAGDYEVRLEINGDTRARLPLRGQAC
jgi:hypothetical protein